jgi:hypothetical protein
MRRIYGPVMRNNMRRIRDTEEINVLLKGEDGKISRVTEMEMVGTCRENGR